MFDIQHTKSVTWDLTRRCNLNCLHCYNGEVYSDELSKYFVKEDLDLETCLSSVDEFYSEGIRHIHFLGGEPLASPYLFAVIQKAISLGIHCTINSTGTLLNEDTQKKLIELGIDQFAVSLDGATPNDNDFIRGNGTFDIVISRMKQFRELINREQSEIKLAVSFTLMATNASSIDQLPNIAKEFDADLISVSMFLDMGNGEKANDMLCMKWNEIYDALEALCKADAETVKIPLQVEGRPFGVEYLKSKYDLPIYYMIKSTLCSAGDQSIYVDAEGWVHPCIGYRYDSAENISLGSYNIANTDLRDILFSDSWQNFLHQKKQYQTENIVGCRDCQYVDLCQPCFLEKQKNVNGIEECKVIRERLSNAYVKVRDCLVVFMHDVIIEENKIIKGSEQVGAFDNNIAQMIISLINEGTDVRSIVETILENYDIDEGKLIADVMVFLQQLQTWQCVQFYDIINDRLQRNNDLAGEKIDGEVVIFDPDNGTIHELNNVASEIWGFVDGKTIELVMDQLKTRYSIEDEYNLRKDLYGFFNEMIRHGILEKVNCIE